MSVLKSFFSKPQVKDSNEFLTSLKHHKESDVLKSIHKFPANKRPDVLANLSMMTRTNMTNLTKTPPVIKRLTAAHYTPYLITMAKTETSADNQKNSVVLARPKELKNFTTNKKVYETDFDLEIPPDNDHRIPEQLGPLKSQRVWKSKPHKFNSKYRVKSKSRRNIKRRMYRNMITKRCRNTSKKSSSGRIAKRSRRYNKI